MKVFYLFMVLAFVACVTPDPVQPEYTFDVWQCNDANDLKVCYTVGLSEPGYVIQVAGDKFEYEIPSNDKGCERSTLTVMPGDVRITLLAEGIRDTKRLVVEQ